MTAETHSNCFIYHSQSMNSIQLSKKFSCWPNQYMFWQTYDHNEMGDNIGRRADAILVSGSHLPFGRECPLAKCPLSSNEAYFFTSVSLFKSLKYEAFQIFFTSTRLHDILDDKTMYWLLCSFNKNVLQFWLSYIRKMLQFNVLDLIYIHHRTQTGGAYTGIPC